MTVCVCAGICGALSHSKQCLCVYVCVLLYDLHFFTLSCVCVCVCLNRLCIESE